MQILDYHRISSDGINLNILSLAIGPNILLA